MGCDILERWRNFNLRPDAPDEGKSEPRAHTDSRLMMVFDLWSSGRVAIFITPLLALFMKFNIITLHPVN